MNFIKLCLMLGLRRGETLLLPGTADETVISVRTLRRILKRNEAVQEEESAGRTLKAPWVHFDTLP